MVFQIRSPTATQNRTEAAFAKKKTPPDCAGGVLDRYVRSV